MGAQTKMRAKSQARTPAKSSARTPARNAARFKAAAAPQPLLQWIMAGLGAMATLAVAAILGAEAMRAETPAQLTANLGAVHTAPSGWLAEIEVRNTGRDTAAAVQVLGVQQGRESGVTLEHVPGEGKATAFMPFAADPRAAPPALRIEGWAEP